MDVLLTCTGPAALEKPAVVLPPDDDKEIEDKAGAQRIKKDIKLPGTSAAPTYANGHAVNNGLNGSHAVPELQLGACAESLLPPSMCLVAIAGVGRRVVCASVWVMVGVVQAPMHERAKAEGRKSEKRGREGEKAGENGVREVRSGKPKTHMRAPSVSYPHMVSERKRGERGQLWTTIGGVLSAETTSEVLGIILVFCITLTILLVAYFPSLFYREDLRRQAQQKVWGCNLVKQQQELRIGPGHPSSFVPSCK
jgi:hypothetical protein